MPAQKRSIVYIDGFNLYYGAIRGSKYKWLNLEKYFTLLRPNDDIQSIRYFTALIDGSHSANQNVYLQALDMLPLVKIILGRFKFKQVNCRVNSCTHRNKIFKMPEEKRTDVNIALAMLDDAYKSKCDCQVLVSGDSDLVPAINLVKKRFPQMKVVVYIPARNSTRGAAVEIRSVADKHRTLPLNILPVSQFPASIPDGNGDSIEKPQSW